MKRILYALSALLLFSVSVIQAAENDTPEARINAAKVSIEKATVNASNIKSAIDDLQQANIYLKKAEDALASIGFMTFGDKKRELEKDVAHNAQMVGLYVSLSGLHASKARSDHDAEQYDKLTLITKKRIGIIESCRSELSKVKGDAAKLGSAASELSVLKSENSKLSEQVSKQNKEIIELKDKLEQARKAVVAPSSPAVVPAPVVK